jgi:TolA-binding protein
MPVEPIRPEPIATPPAAPPRVIPSGENLSPATREELEVEKLLDAPSTFESREQLRAYLSRNLESPLVPRVLLRIGTISLDLGDPAEALRAFETAEVIAPGTPVEQSARRGLALTASAQGDFDAAIKRWVDLMAESPEVRRSPEALDELAWNLTGAGKTEAALQSWNDLDSRLDELGEEARKNYEPRMLLGQGLMFELSGQEQGASSAYQQLTDVYALTREADLARRRLADLSKPLIEGGPPAPSEN